MANVRSEFRIGLKDETRQGAASVARSLDALKTKAAAAGAVLGGLGVGVAVAGLAAQARQVIDLGDKLRDLSFATGQSVEQLSFLDFAAKQSGTSIDAIATASQRLAKNLVDVASGSGKQAAAALSALGLAADDLAKVDLAQQIGTIGEALLKIENPSQRAALGTALFGKQFKSLAPLILEGREGIEELIDQFIRLDGTITRQDADKFDDLNDSIGALQLASRNAGKAIAVELAPALTALFNSLAEGIPKAGPALKSLGNAFTDFLTEQALRLERFNLNFEIFKAELFDSERFRAQAEAAEKSIEAIEDKQRQRRNARRAGRMENSTSAQRTAILSPFFNEGEVGTPEDPEQAARKAERAALAAKRVAEALQRESDDVRNFLQDYARDREATFQREVEQSRARAQALIDEFATPQEKAIKKLDEIARLVGENSDTYGRAAIEAFNDLNPSLEEANDKAKELDKTFADLGATFSSAFEDAILNGEKFSDVLVGLGKDIARLLLRNTVTDPLARLFSSGANSVLEPGGGIGGFLRGLFGNARGGLYKVAGSGGGERPVAFTAQPGEFVAVGRAQSGGGGGGGVTIINNTGVPFNARDRGNVGGRRVLELGVLDALAGAVGTGAGTRELGLSPGLASR